MVDPFEEVEERQRGGHIRHAMPAQLRVVHYAVVRVVGLVRVVPHGVSVETLGKISTGRRGGGVRTARAAPFASCSTQAPSL